MLVEVHGVKLLLGMARRWCPASLSTWESAGSWEGAQPSLGKHLWSSTDLPDSEHQPPSSGLCASSGAQGRITAPGELSLMSFCISERATRFWVGNLSLSMCYLTAPWWSQNSYLVASIFHVKWGKPLNFEICTEWFGMGGSLQTISF